jgi:hypothetical protein
MVVEEKEIIECKSWEKICDYVFEGDASTELPSGVVSVNIQHIPEFFRRIKEYPDRKYVIVSAYSDFGLAYQREHPVWNDMRKWIGICASDEMGYQGLEVPPRCNLEKCNQSHKYSIKCHSFTESTFDKIPDNIVHWFCANCMIVDSPRLTGIPFGVAEGAAEKIAEASRNLHPINNRPGFLYCNWKFYTYERFPLMNFFGRLGWATIVDGHSNPRPFDAFLADLSQHKFVLCPKGNGEDCYRTWEALYMGAVPVVEYCQSAHHFTKLGLPIVFNTRLETVSKGWLEDWMRSNPWAMMQQNWPNDTIKLSFWQGLIEEKKRLLT